MLGRPPSRRVTTDIPKDLYDFFTIAGEAGYIYIDGNMSRELRRHLEAVRAEIQLAAYRTMSKSATPVGAEN